MPTRLPSHCYLPYPATPVAHADNGPLHGLSFAVKDIYDVAGYPTGCGNPHMLALSGIKQDSAPVVQRLLDAGACFNGKVVTDELAFSMTGRNSHFGTPLNGATPDRIPGGSSSGSASAVSNHLCDFAIGSDTGGSVRAPASHCGLIGLRPTHDRITLTGTMPLAPGFDTCGWFARDLETFSRVGTTLLGDDSHALPDIPRLLLASDILEAVATPVRAAFASYIDTLRGIGFDSLRPVQAWTHPTTDLYWAFRYIQGWQAWQSHGQAIDRYGLQLGPGVHERFEWSRQLTQAQIQPHMALQQAFATQFQALLGHDSVLLMPTMPDVAPLVAQPDSEQEDYRNRSLAMLCLAGLAGMPQLTLPYLSVAGVPLGLSLIGPRGSDQSLIALAARLPRPR
ncbi:amidase [Corticimicrobacter populi]|uniref:Amidase n=1 Tax=Corticimicrobacter populi TaxID=2175229 RepID=A0A2V1JW61_9BURK|nr:amidase [Corticimicrobacter populi]PWF21485.1 amidase [Corticimicrobacter populi]